MEEFQHQQSEFNELKRSHNYVKKVLRKKFIQTKESLKETTIQHNKYRDLSNNRSNQIKNRTNFLR